MFRRKLEEKIFYVLMRGSAIFVALCLLAILGVILYKGLPSLSLEMISQTPHGGFYLGREGGILNAIIGSVYLGTGATLLAFLFGMPVVIYTNIYASPHSGIAWF